MNLREEIRFSFKEMLRDLGEECILYLPGSEYEVLAIFSTNYEVFEPSGRLEVSSPSPYITIEDDIVSKYASREIKVEIRGKKWAVLTKEPDGSGKIRLFLSEKR